MKILIVEDEQAGRKLISMMLAGVHEVLAVESVDEAVRQLASGQWDVLLTDYKMPGRTGIELIEHLLANGSTIPVILMTGQSSRDEGVNVVKKKVHKVLTKPFSRRELIEAIAEFAPAVTG